MNKRLILLLSALIMALSATAGDWKQFRGPEGNGASPELGLPTRLDPEDIAWAAPLPGRGLSSPIVIGDRVFLSASSGVHQDRLHVIAFNASDGSRLWERVFWATGRTLSHPKTNVAAPTPTSDGQRLFVLYSSNDLVCLDLDGRLLWLRGLTHDYPNVSNSLGMASSPILAGATLVVQLQTDADSFAFGIDVHSGRNLWKIPRPKAACWTTPSLLPRGPDRPTLVGLQSNKGFHAIDPATGQTVWAYEEGAATIPSSAVSDGLLLLPSHGITALALDEATSAPRQLWRSNQLRPDTASPLIWDDLVYVINGAGVLTCGDLSDGRRVWQLRLKGPFTASPVSAQGHIYLFNEKGLGQVVDVTGVAGKLVGELDLKETILGAPAIAGGALYVRSDGHLWKIARPTLF